MKLARTAPLPPGSDSADLPRLADLEEDLVVVLVDPEDRGVQEDLVDLQDLNLERTESCCCYFCIFSNKNEIMCNTS